MLGTFSFSMGMAVNAFPMRDHTRMEMTTAKSVKAFRAVWLGRKGENLILRSRKAQ